MGTDRDPEKKRKAFVRSIVVLFLALYKCIKSMEPLSSDSHEETRNQKISKHRKGFYVRRSMESNLRPPAGIIKTCS